MLFPLLISLFATIAAAFMSYGVDPRCPIGMIVWTRRLQWPLAALAIVLSIALIALVIAGKRRAWWLIGLLPVAALFIHRFATAPINRFDVADEPAFALAGEAKFVGDDDFVVGLVFKDTPFAYPYACLYRTPVVVQSERADRLMLMWSPRANAVTALAVERELKGRDIDIVSDPHDGLLIHNGRCGQFISAITGMTIDNQKPTSARGRIATTKTTWKEWKSRYPETRVMRPPGGSYRGPTRSLLSEDATPVVLIGGDAPAMIPSQEITEKPMNFLADGVPIVVFRNPAGRAVVFDRHIDKELIPSFKRSTDPRRKDIYLIDSDTGSGWSAAGVAIDGPKEYRGKRLAPVAVQDDLDSRAVRFWYMRLCPQ